MLRWLSLPMFPLLSVRRQAMRPKVLRCIPIPHRLYHLSHCRKLACTMPKVALIRYLHLIIAPCILMAMIIRFPKPSHIRVRLCHRRRYMSMTLMVIWRKQFLTMPMVKQPAWRSIPIINMGITVIVKIWMEMDLRCMTIVNGNIRSMPIKLPLLSLKKSFRGRITISSAKPSIPILLVYWPLHRHISIILRPGNIPRMEDPRNTLTRTVIW